MGEPEEWQEKCSVCGRMVGRSNSPSVMRLMLDTWTYRENWVELVVICERCFSTIMFSGVQLKDVIYAKISDEVE